ncbi:hypothetical protein HDU76_010300, partial [Blyttiomyces sp. JEL0837]
MFIVVQIQGCILILERILILSPSSCKIGTYQPTMTTTAAKESSMESIILSSFAASPASSPTPVPRDSVPTATTTENPKDSDTKTRHRSSIVNANFQRIIQSANVSGSDVSKALKVMHKVQSDLPETDPYRYPQPRSYLARGFSRPMITGKQRKLMGRGVIERAVADVEKDVDGVEDVKKDGENSDGAVHAIAAEIVPAVDFGLKVKLELDSRGMGDDGYLLHGADHIRSERSRVGTANRSNRATSADINRQRSKSALSRAGSAKSHVTSHSHATGSNSVPQLLSAKTTEVHVNAKKLFNITESFMEEHNLLPHSDDEDNLNVNTARTYNTTSRKRKVKMSPELEARMKQWLTSNLPVVTSAEEELKELMGKMAIKDNIDDAYMK